MDWKDTLGKLRDNLDLPEESNEIIEEPPITEEVNRGVLKVIIDKKGRNGKIATIIEGFTLSDEKVEEIARSIKQKLGTGGSARSKEILIQGDRKKEIIEFLNSLGYKAK